MWTQKKNRQNPHRGAAVYDFSASNPSERAISLKYSRDSVIDGGSAEKRGGFRVLWAAVKPANRIFLQIICCFL